MEAKCSSETSVDFYLTARRYIPEEELLITSALRISNRTETNLSVKTIQDRRLEKTA
jgi:hypothetical protein